MATKQTLEKTDEVTQDTPASIKPVQAPALTPVKIHKPIALTDRRMQQGGFARNKWDVTTERGTTHTDLLDPGYWQNVSRRLAATDEVTALSEDGRWYARYLVIGCGKLWAKLHLLEHHALEQDGKDLGERDEDGFDVDWMGPISKNAVIRKKDKAMVKDSFDTKSEAWAWVETHVNGLAAA